MATTARRLVTLSCLSPFLIASIIGLAAAQALDPGSAGRLFVIAFPDTVQNTFDQRYPNRMVQSATLLIYTSQENHVRITSPAGYSYAADIAGGSILSIDLTSKDNPAAQIFQPKPGPLSHTTFRVEADEPVILYCHFMTRYGGEAFAPIPVESWGSEYYVVTSPGQIIKDIRPGSATEYRSWNAAAPAVVSIIAAFDETNVTIIPQPGLRLVGDPPQSTTLNAGECYSVRGFVDTAAANETVVQGDLTGVIVHASRPIGVVAGNPRTAFGHERERTALAENSFKNAAYEWLAPTDQHGTYFVQLPIWDSRRTTGQPGENPEEKRMYERVVMMPTGSDSTRLSIYEGGTLLSARMMAKGTADTSRWAVVLPHVYISNHPAQAFHMPFPVLIHDGTIGPGRPGDGWTDFGGFTQEIVPREQWTSFAPIYAPEGPPSMEHFVAIVSDTTAAPSVFRRYGSRVQFNRGVIPGTDLVWGTATIAAGQLDWFEGRNGARFYAVQYGLWKGLEMFRLGASKRDGTDHRLSQPASYEEITAVAYGLPLAPRRYSLVPSDSFAIDVTDLIDTPERCNVVRIDVLAVNANPAGLRSLYIDDASDNARAVVTKPASGRVAGEREVTVEVRQIDPLRPANGDLVVEDRSGRRTKVPFSIAPRLVRQTGGDTIDFGKRERFSATDADIWFRNPNDIATRIDSISLESGGLAFAITSPSSWPVIVEQHDSLRVVLTYRPSERGKASTDTLFLHTSCSELRTVLMGSSFRQCISMGDLDFGGLRWPVDSGATRTVMLGICNDGDGPMVLSDTLGTDLLVWDGAEFSVSPNWFDSLSGRTIAVGECYSIPVVFRVTKPGTFRTAAHINLGLECGRDSTVWRATVAPIATVESTVAGYRIVDARPIPTSGRLHLSFALGRSGPFVVELIDVAGRGVSALHHGHGIAGEQQLNLDLNGMPVGTYFLRMSSGPWAATRTIVVRR